ncbi:RraA family protein [Sphingomonas sp. MG17]|uniref:Putative 4-hydroxy-4-methyl-2-oxoglutarate aldolase n=1 Tax=Sphingomonas tagetis TaxID=2949092 RepID=A0A9X2HLP0_9SPHN|nr:RraA family protein [Sphingomonas tagetis]MCP3730039.1 RraA family protein [Sphingomonas tagetis]
MNDDLKVRLAKLGTTDLSDAMDRLGVAGQVSGIMPLDKSFSLVGRAWTLRYGSVGPQGGSVGDYIDDVSSDEVIVLDNQGRMDATVWGDLLTLTASRRNVAGTVIDGVCRDIDRALTLNYPIFARGNWMRTGKDRVHVEAVNEPVTVGRVRVAPGDWLRGDGDGLVALPQTQVEEIVATAEEIAQAEDRIRHLVERGGSLREARAANNYHLLQTRRA